MRKRAWEAAKKESERTKREQEEENRRRGQSDLSPGRASRESVATGRASIEEHRRSINSATERTTRISEESNSSQAGSGAGWISRRGRGSGASNSSNGRETRGETSLNGPSAVTNAGEKRKIQDRDSTSDDSDSDCSTDQKKRRNPLSSRKDHCPAGESCFSPASSLSLSQSFQFQSQSPAARDDKIEKGAEGKETDGSEPNPAETPKTAGGKESVASLDDGATKKRTVKPVITAPKNWFGRRKKEDSSESELSDSDSDDESASKPAPFDSHTRKNTNVASSPNSNHKKSALNSDDEPKAEASGDESKRASNGHGKVKTTDVDGDIWMDKPKNQPKQRKPASNPLVIQRREQQQNTAYQENYLSRSQEGADNLWDSDHEEREQRRPRQRRNGNQGGQNAAARGARRPPPQREPRRRDEGDPEQPANQNSRSSSASPSSRYQVGDGPDDSEQLRQGQKQHPELEDPTFGPFENRPLSLTNPEIEATEHAVPAALTRYLPPFQREGIAFMYKAVVNGRGVIIGTL